MASSIAGIALLALAGQAAAQYTPQPVDPERGFPNCANGPLSNNTVCDINADPLVRAQSLVALLTLEEKINLTASTAPAVERLGLPAYTWWQEALHGVALSPGVAFAEDGNYSVATSFPQPILMGAAFDDELVREVADVISTEARAFNNDNRAGLDFWTPNINPYRDPRWGRGQETPGEDPFHLSSYVHSLIDGLQGGYNPKYKKVVATCKHFAGYDIETWNGNHRYQFDAHISQRDLVEYYMPSFQSCARDSNVGAFMCTYNSLNGVPTCADPWLLNDVLRDHWDWETQTNEQKWVTSDCDSVQNIYLPHGYTDTREEAAAAALNAGMDVNCGTYLMHHLPAAYEQGLFEEATLDQAIVRQYRSLIGLGYFDGSIVPWRSLTAANVNTESSQALAKRAAAEGITLLKNDGMLPMQITNGTKIAVIGGWANATEQMQGNYFGQPPYLHSPLWAVEQLGASTTYSQQVSGQTNPTTDDWNSIWEAAEPADIIFYVGGIDNGIEAEDHDRETINWSGPQLDVIGELALSGKPMVVVQMGTMLDSSPLASNPNISALLWGGYPGQDGGVALMDIITGKTAPAGRLPVTQYPADYVTQIPMTDMTLRPNETTGSPGRTYQWYTGEATYEFGFGLHYTDFSASIQAPVVSGSTGSPATYGSSNSSAPIYQISDLLANCNENYQDRCPFTTLAVDIANTGDVTSDYSTLAYVKGTFGPAPHPLKQLKAYTRLHDIKGGETQCAQLNLTMASLARIDNNGYTNLYPGEYEIVIDNQPLASWKFTLEGDVATLNDWPMPPGVEWQDTEYFTGGFGSTYGETLLVNGTVLPDEVEEGGGLGVPQETF